MTVSKCNLTRKMANVFKIILLLLFDICMSEELYMQIVAPRRSSNEKMQQALENALDEANGGRRNILRAAGVQIQAALIEIDNEFPTTAELVDIYCNNIFLNNTSLLVNINYEKLTSTAMDYLTKLAVHFGYPVISWDPFYSHALENDANRLILQMAPTIYHECKAIVLLMEKYNWTDFSIVTTRDIGQDFIDCMDQMINETSTRQGYLIRPRFTNIATVILDYGRSGNDGFLSDIQQLHVKTKMQALKQARSRIMLLHTQHTETLNIMDIAEQMGLHGPSFGWILTSSSIGEVKPLDGTKLPIGTLIISLNWTDDTVAPKAIKTAVKLFSAAMTSVASVQNFVVKEWYASYSCNKSYGDVKWFKGRDLTRKMVEAAHNITDEAFQVSFLKNGFVEHVELLVLNVRPAKDRKWITKQLDYVGRIYPKKTGSKRAMTLDINDIVWPGMMAIPPKGKPEKRYFRVATKKEEPFMMFVPPEEESGQCGHHSVPCLINELNVIPGNKSAQNNSNGTISYCCTGLCVEILIGLADKMKFDYQLYEVPDNQWGVQNQAKQWNGLMKELIDRKADLVVTAFTILETRNDYIDMSVPFLESGITIMVSIRKGAISPYAFLEPYDFNSWILILIFSVHATGASIFIFEWLSPSGLDQGKTSTVEHKFSLFRSFWLIWAMLFGTAVSVDVPRGVSSRFLANIWALFALVFLASYTANLAAFMITLDEYYDLSGIEDWRLIHPTRLTPHFKFATIQNSSPDVNLKQTYPVMHKYMLKYSQPDVETAIANLKNHSIQAFIYDANVLEYKEGRDVDCSLLTVGRWYAMTGYGVGFHKGSDLKDEVDQIILNMQHSGEIERLKAFWLSGACHAKKDKKNKKNSNKIGILNFISAFILLAAGVLLGVILLGLEHLYFKSGRKCLKKYDKCGCCALVSLSMGKSLTFEQSVFEAIGIKRKHKCKDPICEMNIWKTRHQLDMALLKIRHVQKELDIALQRPSYPTKILPVQLPSRDTATEGSAFDV